MYNLNEELIKVIFSNLLYLANLLGLKEEKIIEAIVQKQKIVRKRLASDY